jgi:uncharacterized protein (TIGR02217 family)
MIIDSVFEVCPKFGFTMSIGYAVDITEVANGEEYRSERWVQGLRTASVTVGPGPALNTEVQYVINFYHVVSNAVGFLVKDYSDYKSCTTEETPAVTDQPLVAVDGGYQLVKRYQVGSETRDRYIQRPKSPILFTGGGSLDYSTGIISGGSGGTWGGEFYVPCRFDGELPVEIMEARIQSVTFTLREIRNETDEST